LRRSLTQDKIKLVQVISFRTGLIPSREKERSHYLSCVANAYELTSEYFVLRVAISLRRRDWKIHG